MCSIQYLPLRFFAPFGSALGFKKKISIDQNARIGWRRENRRVLCIFWMFSSYVVIESEWCFGQQLKACIGQQLNVKLFISRLYKRTTTLTWFVLDVYENSEQNGMKSFACKCPKNSEWPIFDGKGEASTGCTEKYSSDRKILAEKLWTNSTSNQNYWIETGRLVGALCVRRRAPLCEYERLLWLCEPYVKPSYHGYSGWIAGNS